MGLAPIILASFPGTNRRRRKGLVSAVREHVLISGRVLIMPSKSSIA